MKNVCDQKVLAVHYGCFTLIYAWLCILSFDCVNVLHSQPICLNLAFMPTRRGKLGKGERLSLEAYKYKENNIHVIIIIIIQNIESSTQKQHIFIDITLVDSYGL